MLRNEGKIALLRGINVGGRNIVPMAGLRELCAGLGWRDVRTYIQSGNVVFSAEGDAGGMEGALEGAIAERFGLSISVVVRSGTAWARAAAANPFGAESEASPNLVMMCVSKGPVRRGAAAELRARAADGERVEVAGGVLWVYYAGGAGRSKLSPGVLDRAAGSAVTARNWRTVGVLRGMVAE